MGIGYGTGENRAKDAAMAAINSPLLDISISGARGVLFAIAGGDDMGMLEVQEAAKIITESIDTDAKVIFGAIKDERLKKNEVKVTVIATGFPEGELDKRQSSQVELIRTTSAPEPEKKRGEIHNSMPAPEKSIPATTEPTSAPVAKQKIVIEDESFLDMEEDWNAVPAFLRRKK